MGMTDYASSLPKVVIIGAGFAGLTAAQKLKKHKVEITLIDKHNHHVFQPFLYQVACGDLSPADISIPIRSEFKNRSHVHVLMDTVIAIDKTSQRVITKNTTLRYDYLIIATGSKENYFGHEAWGKHCYHLKSIEDALYIKERILSTLEREELKQLSHDNSALLTIAIVGGGPTGVEMAGSLAEFRNESIKKDFSFIDPARINILLIEAGPRLLSGFPEKMSKYAFTTLTQQKVAILLNTPVKNIQENLIETDKDKIKSEVIIWAAGVKSNPINQWRDLEVALGRGDKIKVNPDLSLPGIKNIFAVGDIAEVVENGATLPALAAVAKQQGAFVAKAIIARIAKAHKTPKFTYTNLGEMAVIRKYNAIAKFDTFTIKGFFAWLLWWLVHIYFLIGFRNRIVVFINWLWSLLTFGRSNRLILNYSRDKEELVFNSKNEYDCPTTVNKGDDRIR
jgi:NADH dehydrogenase